LKGCSEWWRVVEAAALGPPLRRAVAAVAALLGALELGGVEAQAGADLVGLDLGAGAAFALGGLPAALAQPPVTITRSPLPSESARLMACCRHTLTRWKEVSPSRQVPSFSCTREVTATRMFATAMPLLVRRISGSSTRLPTMVVWLSAAMVRAVETRDALTAQETLIARLAREGLSNPEIGTPLFTSARTVQYHLGKILTKLAISSRSQLDQVLPSDPATAKPK
jgi:DNA-binding CsgD family transcriptional regulator